MARRLEEGIDTERQAALARIGDVRQVLAAGLPPMLELLSPAESRQRTREFYLEVKIAPTTGGVGQVVYRVNGAVVGDLTARPVAISVPYHRRPFTLAPGRNVISVTAFNAQNTVDWQGAPFARLQALPTDARPVTEWADPDQAFRNIAQGIRQVAQAIRQTAADVPIANTLLTVPEGIPPQRRRWVLLLLGAIALLATAGLGWYGYAQHAAPTARALAAGDRFLATGQYEQAKEAYQQALTRTWFDTRVARLGLEKASVFDAVDGEFHPIVIEQRINRILEQSPDDPQNLSQDLTAECRFPDHLL